MQYVFMKWVSYALMLAFLVAFVWIFLGLYLEILLTQSNPQLLDFGLRSTMLVAALAGACISVGIAMHPLEERIMKNIVVPLLGVILGFIFIHVIG